MIEIMPSLQNLIKLSYDSPGFRGVARTMPFQAYPKPGAPG